MSTTAASARASESCSAASPETCKPTDAGPPGLGEGNRPAWARFGPDIPYLLCAWRKMLSPKTLARDVMAGVVVAFVALPLSLAFARAAGAEPHTGIVISVVGGLTAALLGGSEFSVAGPAAVMGVLLINLRQTHGPGGLLLACLLCGLLQVAAGCCRLGKVARYIPLPVISGFTSGLAILVVMTQLPTFLGLQKLADIYKVPLLYLHGHIEHVGWADPLVGGVTVAVMLLTPRRARIPASLAALLAGCLATALLDRVAPGTHVGRLDALHLHLPAPTVEGVNPSRLGELALGGVGLFFLATMQSMLCALSCDSQTASHHHSDQELFGHGLANMAAAFCGGVPVTGVFARSAAGIRSGAATRMTALVHAVVLLLMGLLLGGLARYVPLATLAAILIVTGARMFQGKALVRTWRASRAEGAVLLLTLGVTAATTNMVAGVLSGMGVALAVVAWRAARQLARLSQVEVVDQPGRRIAVHRLRGPFFFGAAPEFVESLEDLHGPSALVLDLEQAWSLDTTSCEAITQLAASLRKRGSVLLLSALGPNRGILQRYGTLDAVGEDNVFPTVAEAVRRAEALAHGNEPANGQASCPA